MHSSTPDFEASASSEPSKRTIYAIVRMDISIEQQIVQSGHAAAEAGRAFYKDDHGIASLIILSVPDKDGLYAARERLQRLGIESDIFFEPDFGMGHSALATRPVTNEERRHFRKWRLWTLERALRLAPLHASSRKSAQETEETTEAAELPELV